MSRNPRLPPDDLILWHRVARTVRPMPGRALPAGDPAVSVASLPKPAGPARASAAPAIAKKPAFPGIGTTLDGGWDRKIARGAMVPDRVIDLHGHSLASAHARLDIGIDSAIRSGARVILLITGRPPRPGHSRIDLPLRGIIRASITDWLNSSRHAPDIAAVRGAHPRHGGQGALYVILRRRVGGADRSAASRTAS